MRDLAARLGASGTGPARRVRAAQRGQLRNSASEAFRPFKARQETEIEELAFVWRAAMGPAGLIRVVDSLSASGARLRATLAGMLTVARVEDGAAVRKGEIMRYLAEIPWNPDAIVRNPHLSWTANADGIQVAAGEGACRGTIAFGLDADGRIATGSAADRPRLVGKAFVETAWRGHFADYAVVEGRVVPRRGEVGWVEDGKTQIVWRGELTEWRLD